MRRLESAPSSISEEKNLFLGHLFDGDFAQVFVALGGT
jgi:hypothetical protein